MWCRRAGLLSAQEARGAMDGQPPRRHPSGLDRRDGAADTRNRISRSWFPSTSYANHPRSNAGFSFVAAIRDLCGLQWPLLSARVGAPCWVVMRASKSSPRKSSSLWVGTMVRAICALFVDPLGKLSSQDPPARAALHPKDGQPLEAAALYGLTKRARARKAEKLGDVFLPDDGAEIPLEQGRK